MRESGDSTTWIEAAALTAAVVALAAYGWAGVPSRYLIVHTLAELFVIVVEVGTAMIVWNSRRLLQNGYLIVLGAAGLFVAGLDLIHTMSYDGMQLLPFRGPDIPTQLWVAARYLQAGSILAAAAFVRRRVRVRDVSLVCGLYTVAIASAVLWLRVFPAAFVPGSGLTAFKTGSEYAVIAVMLLGLGLLFVRRDAFEPDVVRYLAAFIGLLVVAEFAFTMYGTVYAHANLIGHLLRVFAAYALYRAIIVTAVARPYDLLFRELKASEAALAESEQRLRMTFEEAGVGIALIGLDEVCFSVNDEMTRITQRPRERLQGLTAEEITYAEDYGEERKLIAELAAGERVSYTLEKRFVLPDGSLRWVSTTRSLLRADDGAPRYFVAVVDDIHARRESEERLRRAKALSDALTDIDAAMNSSLDADTIMREVVERGGEALGVEAVRLLLREGGEWRASYARGFADIAEGALLSDDEMPLATVIEATRRPLVLDDIEDDARFRDAPYLRASGIRSYLGVPLTFKDEVIGVLTFANLREVDPFVEEQVDFASRLAASLSLALENARLYAVEHRIADTLQEALLSPPPRMPGLEVAHRYRSATEAARVGGDFYEVFEVEPRVVGIIVGDVSGKGLEAAALTAVVKTAIKANVGVGGTPAEVMLRVNDFLFRHTPESAFVTVFFGTLDLTTGRLDYCSGGHPPAVVRRAAGGASLLDATSPIVGAFDGVAFADETETLHPGDTLVLYTDGVIECRGEDGQYGDERLLDAVAGWSGDAAGLPSAVLAAVQGYCGGVLADDVAVVSISRAPEHAVCE